MFHASFDMEGPFAVEGTVDTSCSGPMGKDGLLWNCSGTREWFNVNKAPESSVRSLLPLSASSLCFEDSGVQDLLDFGYDVIRDGADIRPCGNRCFMGFLFPYSASFLTETLRTADESVYENSEQVVLFQRKVAGVAN